MARTRKDASARRADLVDAARTLFFERGVDATSVEAIARAAGVAHGTFYLYFSTKDDAVNAVMAEFARETVTDVAAFALDDSRPVTERLAVVLDAFMGLSAQGQVGASDLISHYHGEEHRAVHDRMTHAVIRELMPIVTDLVEQGIATGDFGPADPSTAAAFALCAAEGIDLGAARSGDDAGTRRAALIEMVLRGLGAGAA